MKKMKYEVSIFYYVFTYLDHLQIYYFQIFIDIIIIIWKCFPLNIFLLLNTNICCWVGVLHDHKHNSQHVVLYVLFTVPTLIKQHKQTVC